MANEIKTLYSDENKQNALYPRTKFNAVSDDEGNTLGNVASYTSEVMESGVDDIKVYGMPPFIDTSNLITTVSSGTLYTAIENCFAIVRVQSAGVSNGIIIDDIVIVDDSSASQHFTIVFPLKKNQTIKLNYSGSILIFGMKY